MKKYPFTPELLDALPEELAELFRGLEDTLLEGICVRLKATDQLNEVTVESIRALRSHGIALDDIKKAVSTTTGTAKERLDDLLNDVISRNQQYYTEAIDLAGLTQPDAFVASAEINAIREQCQREIGNITRSMGFLVDNGRTMMEPAGAYQWALDNAALQIQSGAVSYDSAVSAAVKQLAGSGLKTVDYESRHTDQVDVAVRRAVMTGLNQLNRKFSEQAMEHLKTDLVEVSAHAGARDTGVGYQNHKAWQGKVYRWDKFASQYPAGSAERYPDFETTCGYGDVQGILGANCRHSWGPFVEGLMERTYTDEELARIDDGLGCEFDGRQYTAYEATQMQRRLERQIRKQTRLKKAYKAAGLPDEEKAANAKLRRLREKYHDFSKAAGLTEKTERMKVLNAKSAVKLEHTKRANDIGGTPPGGTKLVGKVDFDDREAVISRLEEAEKELQGLDYEVNYSVTSDGKVWRTLGQSSAVDLSGIPSSLAGSYSYHNHPPKQTYYSFSADDVAFFIDSGEAYSKASDHMFEYIMRRTEDTVVKSYDEVYHRFGQIENAEVFAMKWNGEIDPDIDGYHEVMEILSKELKFLYGREKKS